MHVTLSQHSPTPRAGVIASVRHHENLKLTTRDHVHLVLSVFGSAAQIPSIAWAGTSSRIEASSFSGLLTRVEIGHIQVRYRLIFLAILAIQPRLCAVHIQSLNHSRPPRECPSRIFKTVSTHLAWPGRGVPIVRNHEEDVLDLSGLKYVLTIRHVRYVQCPAPGR